MISQHMVAVALESIEDGEDLIEVAVASVDQITQLNGEANLRSC